MTAPPPSARERLAMQLFAATLRRERPDCFTAAAVDFAPSKLGRARTHALRCFQLADAFLDVAARQEGGRK